MAILNGLAPNPSTVDVDAAAHAIALVHDAPLGILEIVSRNRKRDQVALRTDQARAIEVATPMLDARAVADLVDSKLETRTDAAWRRAALELMREHATSRELRILVALAASGEGEPQLEPFREALTALARRDLRILDALGPMRYYSEPIQLEIVRAIGMARIPGGATWLVARLHEEPLTDAALMELARSADDVDPHEAAAVADALRPFLESERTTQRRNAMSALAAMHDGGVVPFLVESLDSPQSSERSCALAALRKLSGRKLPDSAGAWREWYETETAWWNDEAESTLERLQSESEGEVVAAIRALSMHSLHRDELARALADVLREHASAPVRSQACAGIARLESRVVVPDLIDALRDEDAGVRKAAWSALRAITKLSLPLDADAWEEALVSAAGS